MESVTAPTLTITNNLSLQSPGRRCGHGRHSRPWLCEWEGGRSPPGMSEANLPWPHLRPGALKLPRSSYAYPNTAGYQAKNASKSFDIL